jgi:hypothetical protein
MSLALVITLALQGCVSFSHPQGFEPKLGPLRDLPYEVIGEAESDVSNFNLIWFINVTPKPNFERAIADVINQKGGDDLIEVRWWRERQYWILGTVNIIHIRGKVIKYKTGYD